MWQRGNMSILGNNQTDRGSIMYCTMCGGRFTAPGRSRSCGSIMKSSRPCCHEWEEFDDVRWNVIPGVRWHRTAWLAVWSKQRRREAGMAVWSERWQPRPPGGGTPWKPSHLDAAGAKRAWDPRGKILLIVSSQCSTWLTFSAAISPPVFCLFCCYCCCRHCCCHLINRQVLQQSAPTDGDFLNALLTGGSDSVSGSPLWSPSPSDSGISEDPASDQMDSPQRPDSPSGDAQCFGPKSEAALGAGGCTDLRESHSRKQQQRQQQQQRQPKPFLSAKRIKASSWVHASQKLFNISSLCLIKI